MTSMRAQVGNREVGTGSSCFVIAEIGVNHNGDMDMAHRLVDEATSAGADAVKFQTFRAEFLVSNHSKKANYQLETTGSDDAGQAAMLKPLELSVEQHEDLLAHCRDSGIMFLSTPYDQESADLLRRLGVPAIKIASTDTSNLPFLRAIDEFDTSVILSTGMSELAEVREAVDALSETKRRGKLVVLQCTSEYPAPEGEINLRAIRTMADLFGCPVGFSDHTQGIDASGWAVAAGAVMIEKHFTLDRTLPGPDHRASVVPEELRAMVGQIRRVERALGDGCKGVARSERGNRIALRKSLMLLRPLRAGAVIEADNLASKRPGTGLPPREWDNVVGRRASRELEAGKPLTPEDLR